MSVKIQVERQWVEKNRAEQKVMNDMTEGIEKQRGSAAACTHNDTLAHVSSPNY